jgi:hypothetical protein
MYLDSQELAKTPRFARPALQITANDHENSGAVVRP